MNTTQDHPETALDVAKRRADELAQQWAGFDASFAVGAKQEEKDVPAVVIKVRYHIPLQPFASD